MSSGTDIEAFKQHLQDEASRRRAEAGPTRFPSADAAAPSRAAPPPSRRDQFYGLPVIGYVAKWLVTFFRLPVRISQLYEEIAVLRSQCQSAYNHAAEVREQYDKLRVHARSFADELALQRNELGLFRDRLMRLTASPAAGPRASAAEPPSALFDDFYYRFEERFRGSRDEVSARLTVYSSYLKGLKALGPKYQVLDLGCGRGEWLKLVKEHGLTGVGIDMNQRMIAECQAIGLEAKYGDALEALRAAPSQSLAAVTGFHIVEHLPFSDLLQLAREAHRALVPGGLVLFETPNPENIVVGSCSFYTDPTHKNPIPPPAMGFLLEQAGFKRQDCLRHAATKPKSEPQDAELRDIVARFHVGSDYALIGFKDVVDV